MLGSATLPLSGRKWSFAPGAIAENLTSFGAAFQNSSQTKLTALLDAGTAISSGTVTEPYALPPKFPTAMMYPYYGEVVSAIEAFYLTVQSPFQLLIVGDPLCQPFARAPNDFVRIETAASPPLSRPHAEPATEPADDNGEQSPARAMEITWQRIPDTPVSVATSAMELFLNGKLARRIRPTPNVRINLPPDTHGVVDIRVVLVGNHPTQPRIAVREAIVIGGESHLPQIRQLPSDNPDEMTISIECKDADRVDVMHLGRVIDSLDKASGQLTLTPEQIGRGPVHLQSIATQSGHAILGRTVELDW
jgi:hypothetical protein